MKKPKPGLAELQAMARAHAMEYLSNVPLGLPDLDEDSFTKVMDAITRACVASWAAGYGKGTERGR
jgi:hypothetical protein